MNTAETKLRPLIVDTEKGRYFPLTYALLTSPRLSIVQRQFIMEILSFQIMGGDRPFMSQVDFAKRNGVSRTTTISSIDKLVDDGILWKFPQQGKKQACRYLITPDFLSEVGYEPVGTKFAQSEDGDLGNTEVEVIEEEFVEEVGISDDEIEEAKLIKRELEKYERSNESPF